MSEDLASPEVSNKDNSTGRSIPLLVIAVIVAIYFLEWAQAVFAPLILAVLLSYALYPVVSALRRLYVPRPIGATLIVSLFIALTALTGMTLQNQALDLLDAIPRALEKINGHTNSIESEESVLERVQRTSLEIDRATGNRDVAEDAQEGSIPRIVIQEKRFDLRGFILGGSMSGLVLLSQYITVLLLVLFILSSGNLYKIKIVKISGDTLSKKKITVNILDDINTQLRRFFFVMLIGAVFVGVVTAVAFWWMGVENATLWGAIAGVLSVVPYLGPAIVFVASGLVAFVQFGTLAMGLSVAVVSLVITSVQGNLLTPLMTSRASNMNAVGVFISLLFWGWLWGPIGLIVATPILMIIKSVSDYIESLNAIGELLGD